MYILNVHVFFVYKHMKIWDHARLYLALNEFERRIMFSVLKF